MFDKIKQIIKDGCAKVEALTRLLYQLGTTGWPELTELTQALLDERPTSLEDTPQLTRVVSYLSTLERNMSAYQPSTKRHREDTERLIYQLRALLTDLELHLMIGAQDELSTLHDTLWLGAAQWLLERADEVRDHALLNLLADLSSELGERLLLDPQGFFAEATEMISARLKSCGVGHGPLEVVGYDELFTGGVFEDLRGVSLLKVSTVGALSALLHRAEAGERFECALELSAQLKIGEGAFRALLKSELLEAVCEALKQRDMRHTLSEEQLTALLGDELTASTISDELVMKARFIAERVEVLQLSKLNPMVLCPAGKFWMGSGWGEGYEERPRHLVKISKPFLMGQTQVTQALWQAVMDENPSEFKGSDLPVECVSWFDMVRFCNRLSELENFKPAYSIGSGDKPTVHLDFFANGYRLPTEAEWEYAAKAGTELEYAGSDNLDEVGWYSRNSGYDTHPVAQKAPNAWGLYDMSGNVGEWCNDKWHRDLCPLDRHKSSRVKSDPCNYASAPTWRVYRGGSWYDDANDCRSTDRDVLVAVHAGGFLGGRLLRRNI